MTTTEDILKKWQTDANSSFVAISCADDDRSVLTKRAPYERIILLVDALRVAQEALNIYAQDSYAAGGGIAAEAISETARIIRSGE